MVAFLQALDIKCWKAVVSGWQHPTETNEAGKVSLKSELKWTSAEDDVVVGNCCALNALFNVIDQNVFKLINTCVFAKEAWEILEVAYEGTSKVRTTNFNIKI